MSSLQALVATLRQRNILRVAAIYVAGAFALLQYADLAFPRFGLPDWTITFILAISAVGFPITLILVWFLNKDDQGKQQEVTSEKSSTLAIAAFIVISILALIVGYFYLARFTAEEETKANVSFEASAEVVEAREPSIAVLPFENLSSSQENAYFAAGIHEDVLTHLSRVDGLKVISRTSTLQYESKHGKTVSEIAAELNVDHILEGSVRRFGDDIRITVQLIDARTDQHIWSNNYDRTFANIFAVQSEVAQQVTARLKIELSSEVLQAVSAIPTNNMQAYDLYLKGRELWRPDDDPKRAVEYFRQAIVLDPEFSEAHGMLARAMMSERWFGASWQTIKNPIFESARRAVALNPLSVEAQSALAFAYYFDSKYAEAEPIFNLVLSLAPNDSETHISLATLKSNTERTLEAIQHLRRAVDIDPLNVEALSQLANRLANLDPEQALKYAERALSVKPKSSYALDVAGHAAKANNDFRLAYDYYRREVEANPALSAGYFALHRLLIDIGHFERAGRLLKKIEAVSASPYAPSLFILRQTTLDASNMYGNWFTDEKMAFIQQWLDNIPEYDYPLYVRGLQHAGLARIAQGNENYSEANRLQQLAIQDYEKVLQTYSQGNDRYIYNFDSSWAVLGLARSLAATGQQARADDIVDGIQVDIEANLAFPWARAQRFVAYCQKGEKDNALDALQDAYDFGFTLIWVFEAYGRIYPEIGQDIRFKQIFQKMVDRAKDAYDYVEAQPELSLQM